jgi:hypothetical protein
MMAQVMSNSGLIRVNTRELPMTGGGALGSDSIHLLESPAYMIECTSGAPSLIRKSKDPLGALGGPMPRLRKRADREENQSCFLFKIEL